MTDDSIRTVLRLAAGFNVFGAALFVFPEQIAPFAEIGDAPLLYRGIVALFVLEFGAAYWWAAGSTIDRTIVVLGAIGKAGAFAVGLACSLAGEASLFVPGALAGDLVFAALFTAWLIADRGRARATGGSHV